MSSCEKKLNGYVNLKRTVGYQSTIICKFGCYILACLSSCLITEWLQLPHEATSSCHRVSVYCTVSCFAGSVFTSMEWWQVVSTKHAIRNVWKIRHDLYSQVAYAIVAVKRKWPNNRILNTNYLFTCYETVFHVRLWNRSSNEVTMKVTFQCIKEVGPR